jgi:SAM-dependent methyltransferase
VLLSEAAEQILVCPICKGSLNLKDIGNKLTCLSCQRLFPVHNGIPVFLNDEKLSQNDEKLFRDNLAAEYVSREKRDLLRFAGEHHCIPVMKRLADRFRARLLSESWMLDVGIGYGWHWSDMVDTKVRIVGIDMSLGNLLIAKKILGTDNNVLLVCADASDLPIRDNSISAVWSVQTLQHFPNVVFDCFLEEMNRLLKPSFHAEFYNLHPAALYRGLYGLFGKHLHRTGFTGNMELQRLSESEWIDKWKPFRPDQIRIRVSYSELFFHPDFHIRPDPYPVKMEQFITEHSPGLSSLIARQNVICIESSTDSQCHPARQ